MRPRTSALSIRHTPSPTAGIRCPLLSVTAGGIIDDLLRCPLLISSTAGATSLAAILSSI